MESQKIFFGEGSPKRGLQFQRIEVEERLRLTVKLPWAGNCIDIYLSIQDWRGTSPAEFRTLVYIEDKNGKIRLPIGWYEWSVLHTHIWGNDYQDLLEERDIKLKDGTVTFCILLSPETTSEEKDETDVKPSDRFHEASISGSYQATVNVETDPSVKALTLDLRHLLDDGTHSDVTLKCGETAMPAHSCILSARSEVFAAMLGSDMVESRKGVIEISDMEPPVLNQLLQFIYSGKLSDLSLVTAPQLYAAGDKYDVESLKRLCSDFLQKNLTVGNACDILTLADAHSDGDLKECTVTFILDAQLMKNDGIWLKFCDHHPKLAIEILNRAYKKHAI